MAFNTLVGRSTTELQENRWSLGHKILMIILTQAKCRGRVKKQFQTLLYNDLVITAALFWLEENLSQSFSYVRTPLL